MPSREERFAKLSKCTVAAKKRCARVLLSLSFLSKYFFAKILKIKYIFFPVTDTRIKSFIQEKIAQYDG